MNVGNRRMNKVTTVFVAPLYTCLEQKRKHAHDHPAQRKDMLMKVPATSGPTESRTAELKVGEKNPLKEARGLRHAEAAEEFCSAGAAVAWAAFGSSPRTFEPTISSESMTESKFLASRNVCLSICRY